MPCYLYLGIKYFVAPSEFYSVGKGPKWLFWRWRLQTPDLGCCFVNLDVTCKSLISGRKNMLTSRESTAACMTSIQPLNVACKTKYLGMLECPSKIERLSIYSNICSASRWAHFFPRLTIAKLGFFVFGILTHLSFIPSVKTKSCDSPRVSMKAIKLGHFWMLLPWLQKL